VIHQSHKQTLGGNLYFKIWFRTLHAPSLSVTIIHNESKATRLLLIFYLLLFSHFYNHHTLKFSHVSRIMLNMLFLK